jgi:DNA-binding ferritin-like protein
MKSFKQYLGEAGRCWTGYKPVRGKKAYSKNSCVKESVDKKDTITMDIPLMIRVLELAREDIKSDMDLHRVVERLIDIRNKGALTMDDYDFIAQIKEEVEAIEEHIVKSGSGYKLLSKKTGKNLGTASSKAGIIKREREVEYFKHMKEDGMGGGAVSAAPVNSVAGVAGTGDSRLPASQKEPGVSKKRNPVLKGMARRSPPKM